MQTELASIATAAFQIPDSCLDTLKRKVDKLGRRCVKLGLPSLAVVARKSDERVRYEVKGPYSDEPAMFRTESEAKAFCDRAHFSSKGIRRMALPCTWVELDGAMPIVEGYLFLARVEHTAAGNMISCPRTDMLGPSYDLTTYRTAEPVCEHCHMKRNRKDTFVLRSPEGKIVQIGRNCLADFIRSGNAEVAVAIMALTEEIERMARGSSEDEEGWSGGGWIGRCETIHFLACAVSEVRKNGFKPSSFEGSTKSSAAFLSGPRPTGIGSEDAQRAWDAGQPTDADAAKAAEIIAWGPTWTDSSDYAHNVKMSLALPSVNPRHEGILASAASAYERAMGRESVRKAERAATADSAYQGNVGERAEYILTVLKRASWDSDYGTTVLHTMTDAKGNCFVWRKSGERDALEIGKTYRVKGTVKRHDEYKGTKQTNLSRCTAVECAPDATPDPTVRKASKKAPKAPKSIPAPNASPAASNCSGVQPLTLPSSGRA